MRSPEASWPSALRATYSPPPRVAPHRLASAAAAVGLPFSTRGGRFCRTLYTASPGAGPPWPQIPIRACPERSITRLARPRRSGLARWPSCSYPPTPADSLNPPLNAASSRLRSAPATTGPARTRPAAAPGSSLPLCRTYVTGPEKVATVTTDPSAVRIRVTVTRGLAGAAGTASAAWLAPGRTGADEAAWARVVAEPVAEIEGGRPARLDGPPGGVAAGGELQAASAHRPASEAAVQPRRMVHSLVPRPACPTTIRSLCQAAPSGSPAGAGLRHPRPNWPSRPPSPSPPGCWRPQPSPAARSPAGSAAATTTPRNATAAW